MIKKNQYSMILTDREVDVVNRKLTNKKLTQQDSNYLSKYVRPKLKQLLDLDVQQLLNRLEYNQKIPSIEKRIKSLVLRNVRYVDCILVYGSAVYNNYHDYNDIDIMVLLKKRFWNKLGEKYMLISNLKKLARRMRLKVDIKIYPSRDVYYSYPSNIALIFQLADYKVIYGIIKLPQHIDLSQLDLQMHKDYSLSVLHDIKENGLSDVDSKEIYRAIRNMVVIELILEKQVDNRLLISRIYGYLGKEVAIHLKDGTSLIMYKKVGNLVLNSIYKRIKKRIDVIDKNLRWVA